MTELIDIEKLGSETILEIEVFFEKWKYDNNTFDITSYTIIDGKKIGLVGQDMFTSKEKAILWHKKYMMDISNDIKNEWEEFSKNEYILNRENRIFKLKKGTIGILGIGSAYYLTTKLINESEFKPIIDIVIDSDNHRLQLDSRLPKKFTMSDIFNIAESYFKNYGIN